jgi:hypothetical protein
MELMKRRANNPHLPIIAFFVFNILLMTAAWSADRGALRPFWTEKSSYVEGDLLYSVGVATNAKTLEEGRLAAYKNGTAEIGNFAQITDLAGLTIETQMTFEEDNQDGTYNIFRLLKVEIKQLTKWKTDLLSRATAELEKHNSEVAAGIERKKGQVEILQRQMKELGTLDAQELEILRKLAIMTKNVEKLARCGMTQEEIQKLLGQPRTEDESGARRGIVHWNYGEEWLGFHNGILVTIGFNRRLFVEGAGC